MMAFPEDIGLPITDGGETEYIMIEMNYDNPDIVWREYDVFTRRVQHF